MWIEKLADGVVQVQTPIGPRYVMPSFLQRVIFALDVSQFYDSSSRSSHGRQQRMIDRMCSEQRFASMAYPGHGRSASDRYGRASSADGAGFFAAPPSGSAGIFAWGRSASAPVSSLTALTKGVRSCGGGLGPPHLAPDVCSAISYTSFLC